jgi:2,4-dienoyl-CoA reductase-like NADH-dependent reductase (Old Yellow Enzyme family)
MLSDGPPRSDAPQPVTPRRLAGSGLFRPSSIKGMQLRNRFVRSATWEGLAGADGAATPKLESLYADLAITVGLVITGHAFVDPQGGLGLQQLGAHDDLLVPSLAGLAVEVQRAGGAVALQISHAGLMANRPGAAGGPAAPLGPSPLQTDSGPQGRAMTADQVAAVPPAFARAAARARAAGYDAVQIHAAHGYLLSEFLSPYFNRRADEYGGDAWGRARLAAEVVAAVRTAVGPDYPVLIKLNSEDFLPGGATVDDLLVTAAAVQGAGVDAVELSGGTSLSGDYRSVRTGEALRRRRGAYYEAAALKLRPSLKVPLMLVGGIRTLAEAERVVAEGVADYVSLSRPLICESGLVGRWQRGERRASRCRSCNECFFRGLRGEGVACVR